MCLRYWALASVLCPGEAQGVAVALDVEAVSAGDAGALELEATEPLLQHVAATEPAALDGGLESSEPFIHSLLEAVVDGGFLLPPVRRAAEDEGVFAAVRQSHPLDLDALAHFRPVLFEQLRLHLAQKRARSADEEEPSRLAQRFEVPLARHTPVEDPDPRGFPVERLHLRHHLFEGRRLGLVPGEDLVPER